MRKHLLGLSVLGVFVNAGFDLQRSMAGTLGARGIGQVFEVDPGYPHPMQSNFGLYRIVASEWLNIVSPALFARRKLYRQTRR